MTIAVLLGLGYYWMPHKPAARSLLWVAAVLAALLVMGLLLAMRRDAVGRRREREAADREERIVRALAVRHPGTRATRLSTGRYLLSDLATGHAVGEVDAGEV
ncbi:MULTISPECIES: hypothetical protein [Cupriavidus]